MRKLRLEVCQPQPSNAAPSLFQRRCLRTALSQTAECFSSSVIPLLNLSHFTRWIWRSPQSKVRGQLSSLSTNLLSKQHLSNVLLFLASVPAMTMGHQNPTFHSICTPGRLAPGWPDGGVPCQFAAANCRGASGALRGEFLQLVDGCWSS